MAITYRGNVRLDGDSLQAHLASVLRLENIGLLLGAGASVQAGGETVKGAWGKFIEASPVSARWLLNQGFLVASDIAEDVDERTIPNIEQLVDSLAIAITEWTRVDSELLLQGDQTRADLYRALVRASILNAQWWPSYRATEFAGTELKSHRSVLQKLTASRQPGQPAPWIFTTNYDLAVEWAAESIEMNVSNGFLGLHSRKFSPPSFDLGYRNMQARGEARFGAYNVYLVKLHGSLTWRQFHDQVFELPAEQAWSKLEAFLDEETNELGFMVLPSAAKYLQTVGYVLGELLRRLAEFLSRSQTGLIVNGYSFGDEHINRLLETALHNPTLQLVIYSPEFESLDEMDNLPLTLKKLINKQSPRITIVGGGSEAFFSSLANHLPEPALFDDSLSIFSERIRTRRDNNANEGDADE